MSQSPEDGITPSAEEVISPSEGAISADNKEFKEVRKRLIRAYCRKAHWENRILRGRREIKAVIDKINGHLSCDQHLDYEQFLPPDAQLTSPNRTTGSESIRLISDLRGSLDAAKFRINALLDENNKLRAMLSERGRDLGSQVARLDLIIGDLVQLRRKEQELAKLDENVSLDMMVGQWDGDEDSDEQGTAEADVEVGVAGGDMEMGEAENNMEDVATGEERTAEQNVELRSDDGHSGSTATPPPSLRLQAVRGVEAMGTSSQ